MIHMSRLKGAVDLEMISTATGGEQVINEKNAKEIVAIVSKIHQTLLGEELRPENTIAVDVEFLITSEQKIIILQARPFVIPKQHGEGDLEVEYVYSNTVSQLHQKWFQVYDKLHSTYDAPGYYTLALKNFLAQKKKKWAKHEMEFMCSAIYHLASLNWYTELTSLNTMLDFCDAFPKVDRFSCSVVYTLLALWERDVVNKGNLVPDDGKTVVQALSKDQRKRLYKACVMVEKDISPELKQYMEATEDVKLFSHH